MQSNQARRALGLFLVLFISSCQNQSSKETGHVPDEYSLPPIDAPAPQEKGPLELTVKAVGLSQPHQYKTVIQWRVANVEPSVFFILKRNDWNEGRVVQGGQSFYQDEQVEEGKKYTYQVQMINGPKTGLSDWREIEIPKDKVFEAGEHRVEGKIEGYHRIFLNQDARLNWLGEKLEIITQEIVSDGAILEAFPAGQKQAAQGISGLDAGDLKVRAERLVGDLFVRADGQMGGQGEPGTKGATGAVGDVGANTFLRWGKSQSMPAGAALHGGYYFVCDPPRLPGGTGGPGAPGGEGYQGKRGGNSAKVDIRISDVAEGDIYVTNRPGKGGLGGLGGDGGEGGPGGQPGQIDWQSFASKMPGGADLNVFHQCQPQQGATGEPGPTGPVGPIGEEGYQALFCLSLGGVSSGHCPR